MNHGTWRILAKWRLPQRVRPARIGNAILIPNPIPETHERPARAASRARELDRLHLSDAAAAADCRAGPALEQRVHQSRVPSGAPSARPPAVYSARIRTCAAESRTSPAAPARIPTSLPMCTRLAGDSYDIGRDEQGSPARDIVSSGSLDSGSNASC